MLKFTNIQVARVANGWIVLSDGARSAGGNADDAIVVTEDENLGGAIAAALVAGKLKAADAPAAQEKAVPLVGSISGMAAGISGLATNSAHTDSVNAAQYVNQYLERKAAAMNCAHDNNALSKIWLAQAAQRVEKF